MTALSNDLHVCECLKICIQAQQSSSSFTFYIYQNDVLLQQLREDVLSFIKMKKEKKKNDMKDDESSILTAIATEEEEFSMRNVINVNEEYILDQKMLVTAVATAVVLEEQFDVAIEEEFTVVSEKETAIETEKETVIKIEEETVIETEEKTAIETEEKIATEEERESTTHYHEMFTSVTTSEESDVALNSLAVASAENFISDAIEFEKEIRYYKSLVLVESILFAIMIQD
jgi:hypothetical protein